MRTRGWAGHVPATDTEAITRILAATRGVIDAKGSQSNIADVARALGVTRQTVYHYFSNTEELLAAVAADASWTFAGNLVTALRGMRDPADAIVEGLALTLERLPRDPYIGVVVNPLHVANFAEMPRNTLARDQTRVVLERLDIDWTGFSGDDFDDVVQIILRTLQSFILSPVEPSAELRRLLRVCAGPAITEIQRDSAARLNPGAVVRSRSPKSQG